MYTPQARPGVQVEMLFDEMLVLVANNDVAKTRENEKYVYVDWGPEFYARHSALFPDSAGPALTVNIGWLGLQYILREGGSGYFPQRLVASYLARGELVRVDGAPQFALPAYAVYPRDDGAAALEPALKILRAVCAD
jgi:DNA-binding transcriptional LysR family regulator